jgi:hypothetical protein
MVKKDGPHPKKPEWGAHKTSMIFFKNIEVG